MPLQHPPPPPPPSIFRTRRTRVRLTLGCVGNGAFRRAVLRGGCCCLPGCRCGGAVVRARREVRIGGGARQRAALQLAVPAQGRRGVPGQGVLHLLVLRPGRPDLPQVRRHRRPCHPQARDRRLLCANLPRDHRRLGDGAGRPVRVGAVLQGGDQPGERLLRRHGHAVAVLPGQVLPRPGPHPAVVELQLRAGGPGAGLRRPAQPGGGGQLLRDGVPDGALVLDDAAAAQAVVSRGDGQGVPAHRRRRRGEPNGRVRPRHQHRQRRARVQPHRRRAGEQPHRVLPAVLPGLRRRHRAQPRLRAPGTVLANQRRAVMPKLK